MPTVVGKALCAHTLIRHSAPVIKVVCLIWGLHGHAAWDTIRYIIIGTQDRSLTLQLEEQCSETSTFES